MEKEVCLGMTGKIEWVGWIGNGFGEWSECSVKELLRLGIVIGEEKDASLSIGSEYIEDILKIMGYSLVTFRDLMAALSRGRKIKKNEVVYTSN